MIGGDSILRVKGATITADLDDADQRARESELRCDELTLAESAVRDEVARIRGREQEQADITAARLLDF